MFAHWWTALIEFAIIAAIGWKASSHYDRHDSPSKFDDRFYDSSAIERYARNYLRDPPLKQSKNHPPNDSRRFLLFQENNSLS